MSWSHTPRLCWWAEHGAKNIKVVCPEYRCIHWFPSYCPDAMFKAIYAESPPMWDWEGSNDGKSIFENGVYHVDTLSNCWGPLMSTIQIHSHSINSSTKFKIYLLKISTHMRMLCAFHFNFQGMTRQCEFCNAEQNVVLRLSRCVLSDPDNPFCGARSEHASKCYPDPKKLASLFTYLTARSYIILEYDVQWFQVFDKRAPW